MRKVTVFAKDLRSAMQKVSQRYGDAAMMLSQHKMQDGIELVVGLPEEQSSSTTPDPAIQNVQNELIHLRQLMEQKLNTPTWVGERTEDHTLLVHRLSELGLPIALCEYFAAKGEWDLAIESLKQLLCIAKHDLINTRGVVSLVGPTGVGKTTTIAKIAARFVKTHGADQLALVTTDSVKVAGREQLSMYADILQVPIHIVQEADQLSNVLYKTRDKRLTLIDTAGMSQRDLQLTQKLAKLNNTQMPIQHFLTVSATCSHVLLDEIIQAFSMIPLAGCIATKCDEAIGIGEVASMSLVYQLPLMYLAQGQRVPDDLHRANRDDVVTQMIQTSDNYQPWRATQCMDALLQQQP